MNRHSAGDDGFDDFLAAIESGEGFYLECENGHGSLPPRRLCPHCGSAELEEAELAESGTIETFTVVRVAAPEFEDDAPYATAVADFDGVRLTGQVQGVEFDAVESGMEVEPGIGESETTGERILVFDPR